MPTFSYKALNAAGKEQSGTIDAGSDEEAIQRIKAQGFFPTDVRESKGKGQQQDEITTRRKKKPMSLSIGGVSSKQLTMFTRQLSTLQDAGLPLLRSLQILESQLKPGKLKNVLQDVTEDVEGGSSLSDAMARHPSAFNKLYTKMVNAGEIGGVLDIILQRLAEFMEKSRSLKMKIKSAMIYPVVVVVVAIAILTFIMVYIIPKFETIFSDFGVALPGLTVWLIDTSRWMAGQSPTQTLPGAVYVIAAPVVFFIFFKLARKVDFGRMIFDWTFLRIPVFGGLVRKSTTARFTRTLGTLISAGVPILEAITITRDTSGNWVFERALTKVHDSIRDGESFADPLRESKTCDAIVVNMIDVGEETGDLDAMLMKIADNYDEEVDVAVGGLVKIIEPIMVVVLGGIVGTIVVAMILPLVSIIESLQSGGV